jgi:hypothetical protein
LAFRLLSKHVNEWKLKLIRKNIRVCNKMGENRNAYRILVGKPERKRPLGRLRRRWVNNVKMDLREIGWGDMDWIDLARDRDQWKALVNT